MQEFLSGRISCLSALHYELFYFLILRRLTLANAKYGMLLCFSLGTVLSVFSENFIKGVQYGTFAYLRLCETTFVIHTCR